MFNIRMGIPEMKEFWDSLSKKVKQNTASKNEQLLFKRILNCLNKLRENPRYPGLQTHDIEALTRRYKVKVRESYLENNKPAAGRIFWVYGPNQNDITIIGLEPHPNDKKDSYKKIALSSMGKSSEN